MDNSKKLNIDKRMASTSGFDSEELNQLAKFLDALLEAELSLTERLID